MPLLRPAREIATLWSRRVIAASVDPLLDLLFPARCPSCGDSLPLPHLPSGLCGMCEERLIPIEPPFCRICSLPLSGMILGKVQCPNCHDRPMAFTATIARLAGRGVARHLVHKLKYGEQRRAAAPLAYFMAKALADERLAALESPLLIPVPLHRRRLRQRGFNQAALLAQAVSRTSGWPVVEALKRTRSTPTQTALDRTQRTRNLSGAFQIAPACDPPLFVEKSVVLVDDVVTTGATAHECASVLLKAGVRDVFVLAAVRA